MRISKSNAEAIATKVTEPLSKNIKDCQTKLSEAITKMAEKSVPADVLKTFAKHPEYVTTRKGIYVTGQGIGDRWFSVTLTKQVPFVGDRLEVSPADAKIITKLNDAVEDAKQTYREKKLRIETTIVGLGTRQRVIAALPELEMYMPIKNCTAIALPITEVKKDIKALQKHG